MNQSLETIFVCIKQFNARLGDELSLQIGDRIEILADDSEYNDGWYMGRNTESNAVGLFPKSFTKAEAPLDPKKPSLLRSRSRRVLTGGSTNSGSSASKVPSTPAPAKPLNAKQTTINDIDKALQELQTSSLDPSSNQNRKGSMGHSRNVSTSSMTPDLNPLEANTWTPKQVSSYFAIVLGFDMNVAGMFARHKITGEILFQLDLPHLKELDIDSFGTRFEIFKEIEKLKQISSGAIAHPSKSKESHLYPSSSAPFNNSDESPVNYDSDNNTKAFFKNDTKASKRFSTHLLPSADFRSASDSATVKAASLSRSSSKFHQRTRSQSLDNLNLLDSPNNTTFLSPRKAPEPPSQSPMNTSYKFGGSPMPQPSINSSPNPYSLRDKTHSNNLSRPASSVYETPINGHHRRTSSGVTPHRRHSSVFSFLSGNVDEPIIDSEKFQSQKRASRFFQDGDLTIIGDELDIEDGSISPMKSKSNLTSKAPDSKIENPQGMLKSLRSVSTQNFRNLTVSKKSKTSAFTEGIREINPDEAIKSSNFSGWMAKKSGNSLGWRSRYFTLHGTRLSYYTSLRDRREKGLIDITAHKVLPISTEGDSNTSNDKYIALYAASTGFGRYCFKLVPPAPGFKKGLTFTQPKTHYFAVETQDEMRGWLKALMTATIDIDDSVPVVSSCNTPTVTLAKAQELLTKAREETKLKDEELRARGFVRIGETDDDTTASLSHNYSASSEEPSPVIGSMDETTLSSSNTALAGKNKQPKLTLDTQSKSIRTPSTPQVSSASGGFASPYLLASGLLSPKPNGSSSPKFSQFQADVTTPQASMNDRGDYFGRADAIGSSKGPIVRDDSRDRESVSTPGSTSSKVADGKKRSISDKLMAYTSEGSFSIKSKKK